MALKLSIGFQKKVGLADYGSLGANCHVEFEIDPTLLHDNLDGFHQKARHAFTACQQAVNDQLARQAHNGVARNGNGNASGSGNGNGGGGGSSGNGASSTIPVTIRLSGHVSGAGLDQAAVSVEFVKQRATNVLSVPVTALLATGGGNYAVQAATPPHALIPVSTGLFAAGDVQISGPGIYPGLEVTDSQG